VKLHRAALVVPSPPPLARDHLTAIFRALGWDGVWLGPWSALVHQGTEAGNVIAGPLAAFFEVRWAITVGSGDETVVRIEQTRNTWTGKGGILDGKRAGARFDAILGAVRTCWPDAVALAA